MAVAFAREAIRIREVGGLSDAQIGRAVGAAPSTLRDWLALYLAQDEATLWAEWYRHLAEHGIPPLRQLPRDVWHVRVSALHIADLTGKERLERVGLSLPKPGRSTWPRYQELGERLSHDGW